MAQDAFNPLPTAPVDRSFSELCTLISCFHLAVTPPHPHPTASMRMASILEAYLVVFVVREWETDLSGEELKALLERNIIANIVTTTQVVTSEKYAAAFRGSASPSLWRSIAVPAATSIHILGTIDDARSSIRWKAQSLHGCVT